MEFLQLGRRPYELVLQEQYRLREARRDGQICDTILLVEHPRVITEGRRDATADYKLPLQELRKLGVEVAKVNRGGRLTYHGPGQLVVYFILDIRARGWSVPTLVRIVEECGIRTFAKVGLAVGREPGCPGLWIEGRKIGSIGLSVDRGISMHGLALNFDPDLEAYRWIIPCGAESCTMTSFKKETGRECSEEEYCRAFCEAASEVVASGEIF